MSTRVPPNGTVRVGLRAQLCSSWVFFDFFENVQVFCAALSCPVAAMHNFFELYRCGAQVWVVSIHPTPGMARYQPRTMVFGGSGCPHMLSATLRSGSVGGGGALQAARGLEHEPPVINNHLNIKFSACTACWDRARWFERSILLELGVF
jgi:hypothetical protein